MVTVRTPGRLHFGLLNPGSGDSRRFGGVGLMIDTPGIQIEACRAPATKVHGDAPADVLQRSEALLGLVRRRLETDLFVDVCVTTETTLHSGLGTGTQLALALTTAIARLVGRTLTLQELARIAQRGLRSAIGIHGFHHGGLIADGGKRNEPVAPMIARLSFPSDWPILLIRPIPSPSISGEKEIQAFECAAQREDGGESSGRLAHLLIEMLASAAEAEFCPFAAAVHDYNRLAGDWFAHQQGGSYSDQRIADLVASLRRHGCSATGQSSWGPTVFAICEDHERAASLKQLIKTEFGLRTNAFCITQANNQGAHVTED